MNQQGPDTLPSVELPSPAVEPTAPEYETQGTPISEKTVSQQVEQGISTPDPSPMLSHAPQKAVPPHAAPLVAPHDAPPSGVVGVAVTPQIADDADLIEKEWVDKAKQIVERTRHDPHEQNKEMNKMKADYLKKRYNKDVKLSE
jgi:hypothetical protein